MKDESASSTKAIFDRAAREVAAWNPDIAARWLRAVEIARARLAHPLETRTSFFKSPSAEACAEAKRAWAAGTAPREGIYARIGHPEGWALEDALAALEEMPAGPKVAASRVTSTGMAAVAATIEGLLERNRHEPPKHAVVSRHLFGAASALFDRIGGREGIEVTYIDGVDPQEWEDAVRPDTRLFFFETPTNPLLHLIDIKAVADIAHAADRHITVVVDGSVSSALAQPVFHLGADIVCRSITKYFSEGHNLGGYVATKKKTVHTDLVFGILAGRDAMAPQAARDYLEKVETLGLRFRNQSDTARDLADHVRRTYGARVLYPGLEGHPQQELAERQMPKRADGAVIGGGVFTVDFGSEAAAFRAQNILLKHGASLETNFGQDEFHATHQASNTYVKYRDDRRLACGITDGIVRFSPGDLARLSHWKMAFDDVFEGSITRRSPFLDAKRGNQHSVDALCAS